MKKKALIIFVAFFLGCTLVYLMQYVQFNKSSKLRLTAHADNVVVDSVRDIGEQIIEDTRYSVFSFADTVQNIWKGAAEMYVKEWTGGYFIDNPVKNSAVSSLLVNQYLANYANNSTFLSTKQNK